MASGWCRCHLSVNLVCLISPYMTVRPPPLPPCRTHSQGTPVKDQLSEAAMSTLRPPPLPTITLVDDLRPSEVNLLLLYASRIGDKASVRHLCRGGGSSGAIGGTSGDQVDVNVTDDEGRTALMFACLGGHVDCARELLQAGALALQPDRSGRTALHWAARFGHRLLVKLLLSWSSSYGSWSWSVARSCTNPDATDTATASASDLLLNARDYQGKKAVHCAAMAETSHALAYLLKRHQRQRRKRRHQHRQQPSDHQLYPDHSTDGAVDERDADAMTPLHWAAYVGSTQAVLTLLRWCDGVGVGVGVGSSTATTTATTTATDAHRQPTVMAVDVEGKTALHWCTGNQHVRCLARLLRYAPALAQVKDVRGQTALHLACQQGFIASAYYLATADPSLLYHTDHQARTPLHCASSTSAKRRRPLISTHPLYPLHHGSYSYAFSSSLSLATSSLFLYSRRPGFGRQDLTGAGSSPTPTGRVRSHALALCHPGQLSGKLVCDVCA